VAVFGEQCVQSLAHRPNSIFVSEERSADNFNTDDIILAEIASGLDLEKFDSSQCVHQI
jgi:hypothetical protein